MKNVLPLFLVAAAPCAALISSADASAKQLSPDEALARALASQPSRYLGRVNNTRSDASSYILHYTSHIPGDESKAGCYYFKSADGFLVTSADDRAVPILAYGSDTSFDSKDMSPELEWWLSEYGREMAAAPDNPYLDEGITDPKDAIAPICKTKWNQFGPYYDMCSKEYGQPVVTGCVATALAQVLKVHNWPATGEGTRTYTSDGKEFTFDYTTADFQWDLMLDSYWAKAPEDTKAAVSELMYACGVAVGMHYHPGGSGADPAVMCYTLPKYMKYDASIYNAQRMYYGIQEWTDLIYAQLQKGQPVQYSGYVSSGGGHSFVCDGYSQGGYFHFNWGWGGASDGYYLLTSLSPTHRGVGAPEARGGFNFNQDAVINIFPAGATPSLPYYGVMNADDFHIAQNYSFAGNEITIHGAYWNTGCTEIKGEFGVAAVNERGDTTIMPGRVITDYWSNEGLGGYSAQIPKDIVPGKYTVSPIFKYNGEWLPIRTAVNSTGSETMTVSQEGTRMKAVFTHPVKTGEIAAVNLEMKDSVIDLEHYTGVRATLENTTDAEWIGALAAGIFNKEGKLMAYGMRMEIDIPASSDQPLTYSSEMKYRPMGDSIQNGPATLYIIDYYSHKPISGGIPVTITGAPQSSVECLPTIGGKPTGEVKIYTPQGAMITSGEAEETIATLPRGIYIVVDTEGRTAKIAH